MRQVKHQLKDMQQRFEHQSKQVSAMRAQQSQQAELLSAADEPNLHKLGLEVQDVQQPAQHPVPAASSGAAVLLLLPALICMILRLGPVSALMKHFAVCQVCDCLLCMVMLHLELTAVTLMLLAKSLAVCCLNQLDCHHCTQLCYAKIRIRVLQPSSAHVCLTSYFTHIPAGFMLFDPSRRASTCTCQLLLVMRRCSSVLQ